MNLTVPFWPAILLAMGLATSSLASSRCPAVWPRTLNTRFSSQTVRLKEYKVGGTQLDIPALGIFHTWHALTDGLVTANQWSHLSAVIDPANESMTLYVNGLLVAERTNVTAGPDLSQGLAGQVTIGGIPSGAGAQMFAGQIDDFRIWNVARPIDQLAAVDVADSSAGLVLSMRADDGSSLAEASVEDFTVCSGLAN